MGSQKNNVVSVMYASISGALRLCKVFVRMLLPEALSLSTLSQVIRWDGVNTALALWACEIAY